MSIIDARVIQKTDTEDKWLQNELTLYKGELALVQSDNQIINIKVGTGRHKFRDLPYLINYTSGLYTKEITPSSYPSGDAYQSYIVTEAGTYTNFGGVVLPKDNIGVIYKNLNQYTISLLPIVSEDTLKEFINERLVDANLGFGGQLTDLSQSATVQGMYIPRVEGAYPNFGGLEYDSSEGLVVFLYKDDEYTKISIPLDAVDEDVRFNNEVLGVSGKAVEKFAVKKINNIAELRATKGEYEGQIIELLGYYNAGEYSLKYKWSNTQLIDDSGSVINSDNGSWLALIQEAMPEYYGAKGDGNYDDHSAFQKCIDNHEVVFLGKEKKQNTYSTYSISKHLTVRKKLKIYGKGKEYTRIKITNPSYSGSVYSYGGQSYIFDQPSIFELIPTNENVLRYFTLEDLTTFGIETNTDIIHINAPRVSYLNVKNVDSYYGQNFIKVSLQSWIIGLENCRASLFNMPHFDIRNSNTVRMVDLYANSAQTSSGASRGYRIENSVVLMLNCDTDSVNFGFTAYGNSVVDLVGCRTESRLYLVQANDKSLINVYGGNYMQTMISSQVSSKSATFEALGNSTINIYTPYVGLYNFTESTDLSNKKLYKALGGSVINIYGIKVRDEHPIPVSYLESGAANTGSVINNVYDNNKIILGNSDLTNSGLITNYRNLNIKSSFTDYINIVEIPLLANDLISGKLEVNGVVSNGVEGKTSQFYFKVNINCMYYNTYVSNNITDFKYYNQEYDNMLFTEILFTSGKFIVRLRKHTEDTSQIYIRGEVNYNRCNSLLNKGG